MSFNKNNKKSNETLMKIRAGNRSAALVVIFIIIIFGLLLRIAWIQFVEVKSIKEGLSTAKQR